MRLVETGHAEECLVESAQGAAVQRRHAAIGDAAVVVVAVGRGQCGVRPQRGGDGGGHADEAALVELTVVVELLVSRVEACAEVVPDRPVRIDGDGKRTVLVHLTLHRGEGVQRIGGLADPVDHATATAAPENQRIGAFQHFDAVDIVQGAVILRIVAQAVEIEVGSAFLTPDEDFVAMAFAAFQAHAGHIAQGLAQLGDGLVVDLVAGDDGDGLRHVDERGGGLGGAAAVVGAVAILRAGDDDVCRQIIAFGVERGGGICEGGSRHHHQGESQCRGGEVAGHGDFLRMILKLCEPAIARYSQLQPLLWFWPKLP